MDSALSECRRVFVLFCPIIIQTISLPCSLPLQGAEGTQPLLCLLISSYILLGFLFCFFIFLYLFFSVFSFYCCSCMANLILCPCPTFFYGTSMYASYGPYCISEHKKKCVSPFFFSFLFLN